MGGIVNRDLCEVKFKIYFEIRAMEKHILG